MDGPGVDVDPPESRILVVEDEPALQEVLLQGLNLAGYECESASSCEEGRQKFERNRYSCILVDLGLPDGSGQDLLAELTEADPNVVAIVLTGDGRADSILDSMRGGAFDYLTKPIDITTLQAAVHRAEAHHAVVSERDRLLELVLAEREQLRARIDQATEDIRQYATACEKSNDRLKGLLELARVSSNYYTDESLLVRVFDTLAGHLPIRGLVLCDSHRTTLMAVVKSSEDSEREFVRSDGGADALDLDPLLLEAQPEVLIESWLHRHANLDGEALPSQVFPLRGWNGSACTVGFYFSDGFKSAAHDQEFLDMCAHFLVFEWERTQLQLHVGHLASLGNIAVELSRNFLQPLTAIQTAADFVGELVVGPDAEEGMGIVHENVQRLRQQTQEYRKLSLLREDSMETVSLDQYVDQALDMLSVAIQNRGVRVEKTYADDCECVLINGTALARTFLDLILGAVRSIEPGGELQVRLDGATRDHVAFELAHSGTFSHLMGLPDDSMVTGGADLQGTHPGMQLAQRTVQGCGGTLSLDRLESGGTLIRVVLPRNASNLAETGVA